MRVLVDTNILLRSAQPNHPLCSQATQAVAGTTKATATAAAGARASSDAAVAEDTARNLASNSLANAGNNP